MSEMGFYEFINKKFVDWQKEQGKRKTVEEFAAFIGASRPLVNAWLNGHREPTQRYKDRLIDLFGNEALEAFGIDPDRHMVETNWDSLSPETRRRIVDLATKKSQKNDPKRTSQKRTTRESD